MSIRRNLIPDKGPILKSGIEYILLKIKIHSQSQPISGYFDFIFSTVNH